MVVVVVVVDDRTVDSSNGLNALPCLLMMQPLSRQTPPYRYPPKFALPQPKQVRYSTSY